MKKTSKLLGAVALSATLALGCAAPAFATTADVENADRELTTSKSADTFINVKTEVDQIDVTIPLHTTIVAKTSGALITPTNYQIMNNSTTEIAVSGISASELDSTNWKLSSASVAGKDATAAGADFYLKLTPQIDTWEKEGTNDATKVSTGNAPANSEIVLQNGAVTIPTSFPAIPGKTTAGTTVTSKAMLFSWTGSEVSNLKGTIKDDKTSLDVFKVTYTVGVNGKITANETHNGGNAAHTA